MRIPLIAPIGLLSLGATIVLAVLSGSGLWNELATIFSLPWGRATVVDLYFGFALFSGWIHYRESSLWHAAPWIVATFLLGNLVPGFYVILTAARASSPTEFWNGAEETP